jgi:hypothetical protein
VPGALVLGSAAMVKEAIVRAKGKGDGPSLAEVPAFQKAAKDFEAKPGLVLFANPAPIIDVLEKADLGRDGQQVMKIVKTIVNPKAIVAVGDQLTLDNGALKYRRRVYLDAEVSCPLLNVLPRKALPSGLLHFVAPDALAFLALANDDGEQRWQRLVELFDGIHKAAGHEDDALPSQHLGKLEGVLGLTIGKEVVGKIKGLAVSVAGLKQLIGMKARRDIPVVLIVEATDAEAAGFLAKDALPKIFSVLAREKEITPKEEKVGKHLIVTMESKRGYALHYGKEGNTLVLGPSRSAVVESLTNGGQKKGLLGDEKLAARIHKDAIAVGMIRPLTLASYWLLRSAPSPDRVPFDTPEKRRSRQRLEEPSAPPKEAAPKEMQDFLEILKNEEALMVNMSRTKDHLEMEATYPGLRPLLARLINFALEQEARGRSGGVPFGGKIEKKGR